MDFPFQPMGLARKIAGELKLADWRVKLRDDTRTKRWADLFDRIEPNDGVVEATAMLLNATNGGVAPHYLFGVVLAAYAYGFADACDKLADEDITLWNGKPLDFPWDESPKIPAPEGPNVDGFPIAADAMPQWKGY